MSESATQAAGPTLEQLLSRAMHRGAEDPALLDVEEFADRVVGPLTQATSSEQWVDRFFAGNVELRAIVAPDLTHTAPRPYSPAALHVYEFDLDRLEYVVLEEDDQFVVVSDSGQFSVPAGASAKNAIASAAIPSRPDGSEAPRAWLVRKDGSLEPLHPGKLARALSGSGLRQVSLQAVARPASRLQRWSPRRTEVTGERALRARRENEGRRLLGLGAPAGALPGGADAGIDEETSSGSAEPAVFMLLPDGALAQPQIGSATRWSEMVSGWLIRGGLLAAGGDQKRVSGRQRYTISAGKVSAVFTSSGGGSPGAVGNRAAANAEALSLVRADFAPVRVLGDEELAAAVVSGNAQVVAGWKGPLANVAAAADGYWIQPEAYFAPSADEQRLVARLDSAAGLEAPSTDEVIAGGEEAPGIADARATAQPPSGDVAEPIAQASRPAAALSAPDQVLVQVPPPAPPIALPEPLTLAEPSPALPPTRTGFPAPPAPAVAPAAPAVVPAVAAVSPRVPAAFVRAVPAIAAVPPALPTLTPVARPPLAPLSGALPRTALDALHLSVERTAAAGAHRIPIRSIPRVELRPDHARDGKAPLPRTMVPARRKPAVAPLRPWRRPLAPRPVAPFGRVLVSLPFPNSGEVHVGHDLSHALHAALAAPVLPLPPAAPLPRPLDTNHGGRRHSLALASARRAALRLGIPEVGELLSSQQAASLRLLPALLGHALRAGGDWIPGPGAPMPAEVRAFAAHGSFAVPEVLLRRESSAAVSAGEPVRRPLGVGEDEIVIPTPLWSEMGRGSVPAAHNLMASPMARSSYVPPLGSYRVLVPPSGFALIDSTKHEVPLGSVELAGPAAVHLEEARGHLQALGEPGRLVLRSGAEEEAPQRRGRIRIGAPLLHRAAPSSAALPIPDASRATAQPRQQERLLPRPVAPAAQLPWPTEGTIVAPAPGVRPMSTALQEALRIGRELAARAVPAPPPVAKTFPRGTVERVGPLARSTSAPIPPPREPLLVPANVPGAVALSSWQPYAGDWAPGERWAGTDRDATRAARTYAGAELRPVSRSIEGAALQRTPEPARGSFPTGLRFRYVSAPLWWSSSLRSPPPVAAAQPRITDAQRSLGSALKASNLAGSLWRSILSGSGNEIDPSSGMDRRHDEPARELSGVARRLDVLAQRGLVGKAAAPDVSPPVARGPETVYVAIDEQGRAGPVARDQLKKIRSLAQTVDMRVVAALPPTPPPLESMSARRGIPDAEVPRARHPQAKAEEDKADGAVSYSKIEGSVEAVAQRIYHRVRRRLASDRERFGG